MFMSIHLVIQMSNSKTIILDFIQCEIEQRMLDFDSWILIQTYSSVFIVDLDTIKFKIW